MIDIFQIDGASNLDISKPSSYKTSCQIIWPDFRGQILNTQVQCSNGEAYSSDLFIQLDEVRMLQFQNDDENYSFLKYLLNTGYKS